MRNYRGFFVIVLFIFLCAGIVSCKQEGPAEKAGENIDQAIEKVGDKMKEAGEAVQEKAEEVKESAQ